MWNNSIFSLKPEEIPSTCQVLRTQLLSETHEAEENNHYESEAVRAAKCASHSCHSTTDCLKKADDTNAPDTKA